MRVVIKVGTNVITDKGKVAEHRIMNIIDLIVLLKEQGDEVILVSSGAVAAGYSMLPLDKKVLSNRQALSSIGQPILMDIYRKIFRYSNIACSQILLTADTFKSDKMIENSKKTIDVLLSNDIVPIINENDTVAIDELVFGDNDNLASYATHYFDAELLVILSDIDALYNKDPRENKDAIKRDIVNTILKEELSQKHSPHNEFSTGGIVTKLQAAEFLLSKGRKMFLASGINIIPAESFLIDNKQIDGTLFK